MKSIQLSTNWATSSTRPTFFLTQHVNEVVDQNFLQAMGKSVFKLCHLLAILGLDVAQIEDTKKPLIKMIKPRIYWRRAHAERVYPARVLHKLFTSNFNWFRFFSVRRNDEIWRQIKQSENQPLQCFGRKAWIKTGINYVVKEKTPINFTEQQML